MSALLEALKDFAAPIAALAGATIGYGGGMRKDRESRYHQRVEHLYQDMLTDLATDHTDLMQHFGGRLLSDEVVEYDPRARRDIHSRAEIFAAPEVFTAWEAAYKPLRGIRLALRLKSNKTSVGDIDEAVELYYAARTRLVRSMREDLRVRGTRGPLRRWAHALRPRLRWRRRPAQIGSE
ncbi:hypothetical protein HPO96_23240 [Kribbella sandramycini]|uniref:Uncharacterized protein n=1 Tax=Kribbella sandramycini TaxID=60450 RepID=A0A7Y4L2H6_9ACTN|nr:hypothetical protein [Kribbella sandramycini]MBB6566168.1 hypothetical protein [Kribbella sandramycini]NOL43164.1 hypothetical protein [Kribbella sandramycini]